MWMEDKTHKSRISIVENLLFDMKIECFGETHTSLQAISGFLPLKGSLEFGNSAWK